jgi:hypothetical protein
LIEVDEGVDVGLLHHVFDVAFVVHHRAGHPVDALVVPAHQDLEQRAVPGSNALDDLPVGHRRGHHGRGVEVGW